MKPDRAESLTDVSYWDRTWSDRDVPAPLDPRGAGLNAVVPRALHRFFTRAFADCALRRGDRVIEAGCGGSVFLPYFEREFGLAADGIDNSPEGCSLSRAIAAKSSTSSRIFCADVFDPPNEMLGAYRMVYSTGLAEHFIPTKKIIEALRAYLQPDGHLITLVPNMRGLPGLLQRAVDPAVFGVHVPLTPGELADAHAACGLDVVRAEYLMGINLSVVNFSAPTSRIPPGVGLRATSWASKSIWSIERLGLQLPPNSMTSPLVAVIARLGSGTSRRTSPA